MTNINLLENQLSTDNYLKARGFLLVAKRILVSLIILVLLATGIIWLWSSRVASQSESVRAEMAVKEQQLSQEMQDSREPVVHRQAQLQNLSVLLPEHVYWSQAIALINDNIISGIQLNNFNGSSRNAQISFSGVAVDMPTLASFIQTLNQVEYIEHVRLGSSSLSGSEGAARYTFNMTISLDPRVFLYNQGEN